jgi:transcription elongation factor GreB
MDDLGSRDDDDDDARDALRGRRNYITRQGYAARQEELRQLLRVERPRVVEVVSWAAGNGDRSENGDYLYGKKRLREIDRRIRFLTKRLEIAEIVDPLLQTNREQVFFGARVTYATPDGAEKTVTIVGEDEADSDRGLISWISPVATALIKAYEGDEVALRTPAGRVLLTVRAIDYPG